MTDLPAFSYTSTSEIPTLSNTFQSLKKDLTLFTLVIECKKCGKQYVGETKRHLHESFGEHRVLVLLLFLNIIIWADHSINEVLLIPLELISSKRDSVRKARKAHPIDKAMTLEPGGINRRDQLSFLVAFIFLVAYHFIRLPCIQISHM